MKKIGFIDYYLSEWHADNYPKFFNERSEGRYEVCCAYGKIDNPNGITNKEWSEKFGIPLADSIQEVIEKSDCLIVLSPDNPEMHEELTHLALMSGKPTYIDKTFAPDKATAMRIFEHADKYGTPCFSTSALRYPEEMKDIDASLISKIYAEGSGDFENYSIHQIEPIVKLMNCPAKRVMFTGTDRHPAMVIEFEDGRQASMFNRICVPCAFRFLVLNEHNRGDIEYVIKSRYFDRFIDDVIKFFDTGVVPVPHEQTVQVIAIREAGIKAKKTPFTWVEV